MSVVELSRPASKEVIRLTQEQEACIRIAHLTQRIRDLQLRETTTTPEYSVMYGFRPAPKQKPKGSREVPTPRAETYAYDRDYTVTFLFEETPTDLHLIISNTTQPKPDDGVKVHFQRRGTGEDFVMVGVPMQLDHSPQDSEVILGLVADANGLVDRMDSI